MNNQSMKMTRGQRNNNPLNIRHSSDQWQGERPMQTDPAFVQFENNAYGYRAAWRVIHTYSRIFRKEEKPFCIESILNRWAPPSENHTSAYVKAVAGLTKLGGKELLLPPVKLKDFYKLANILAAMTCVECGIRMQDVDMEAICEGYRLAFPKNEGKLKKILKALDEYSDWK